MMRNRFLNQIIFVVGMLIVFPFDSYGQGRPARPGRVVLVELFTSQGCDMCPTAEKILGDLGASNKSVAPVSLHVDYFNRPWKDPFSDKLNSDRQMSYHKTFKGPKDPTLGLYYTPMIMVDGMATVNGRDSEGLKRAVAAAKKKLPGVTIEAKIAREITPGKAILNVKVTPVSSKISGKDQLICAILRAEKNSTKVESGENAGKTLENRYPSLKFKFEKLKFEGKSPKDAVFEFEVDKEMDAANLDFVIFVQDVTTGEVHQTAVIPMLTNS